MATNPRQQGRPGSGDYTGRQKAQANKEARLDDQDRSAEISMATQTARQDEEFGVFDAHTGERVDGPAAIEVEEETQEAAFFGFPGAVEEQVLTGKETPEEIAPVIAARKTFTRPPVETAYSSVVRIRVDQDIEDMTYGMTVSGEPNNYTFREGLMYDVPYPVAEHLNNLGLIRQFIRT